MKRKQATSKKAFRMANSHVHSSLKSATASRARGRKQKPTSTRAARKRRTKSRKHKVPKSPLGVDLVALAEAARKGGNVLFPEIPRPRARAYLAAYALTGKFVTAAALAGIDLKTGLNWRNDENDKVFRTALTAAQALACDLLEAEIVRRAVEGIDEPVYQQGRLVGFVRKYSDRLLELAVKGGLPEKYRERFEHTGAGGAPLFALPMTCRVDLGNLPKEQ